MINGDQKKIFHIVNTLLGCRKQLVLPDYNNPITLASTFNIFVLIKLRTFVQSFHWLRAHYPLIRFSRWILICLYYSFTMIMSEELIKIVSVMNKTTCSSDPFPSSSYPSTIIDTIMHIINICLSTSMFPSSCKSVIVLSLINQETWSRSTG